MTKSFYGMVYRGGIALPVGVDNVKFLMQHNDDIELFERFTSQDAYIWATQIYVERQNQLQRYTMPIIPQMEDLIYKAYHEQNFMEHVPTNRFFAVIANGYVGLYSRGCWKTPVKEKHKQFFDKMSLKEVNNLCQIHFTTKI